MDLGLRGKNVIVTGGSRGIGRSIALAFADEGANVAICARGADALASVRSELAARGVTAFAQSCDVGDATALAGFLDAANAALGGIDVLVNNPSGFGLGDGEEAWSLGFNVDMMAAVRASRQVVPWMEARGGGAIVHISSISGMEGTTRQAAYAAMKAAMISHSKSLALTLAPKNIRVNCVCPGSVDTPLLEKEMDDLGGADLQRLKFASRHPMNRIATPEEVANAVVYLASDAASFVTGTALPVDGGRAAW